MQSLPYLCPMQLFLQNVRIVPDPSGQTQHLFIRDGLIESIGPDITAPQGAEIWDLQGACASIGWFDVGAQVCDPGLEHREDIHSLAAAAAAGGFTAIAPFPNTVPALHGKAEILYIRNKSAAEPVDFYPIGALSVDCAGKDMAELFDMHAAGVVAFSDGVQPIQDAGLLLRALQYVQAFDGIVFNRPHHAAIAGAGQMHEGLAATMLGMKGIPALAESLVVQRDLSLLEYAGGRLHIHLLSAKSSVDMVRRAKEAGLSVSASVALANLLFTDEVLLGEAEAGKSPFNSHWKLQPPLRSQADQDALWAGLQDGVIDFICSNHVPWDPEAKNLEFPYAEFGMNALESFFGLYGRFGAERLSLNAFIDKISVRPRTVLKLPVPEIRPGARASLTLFDPEQEWTFQAARMRSKSGNTPFDGYTLKGKVLGTVNGHIFTKNG